MGDNITRLGSAGRKVPDDMSEWTPRQVLMAVLERLDSGEIEADQMVVVYAGRPEGDNNGHIIGYKVCGADPFTSVGMLHKTIAVMLED